MQDSKVATNRPFQTNPQGEISSDTKLGDQQHVHHEAFQIDAKILLARINKEKNEHLKDQMKPAETKILVEAQRIDFNHKDEKPQNVQLFTNSISQKSQDQKIASNFKSRDPSNKLTLNQSQYHLNAHIKANLPEMSHVPQDQPKIHEPILTKKQIQEQKQYLNELKEKKKEEQRKKIVQKINEEQKARLEKLKQQTRQYQEMKKQKDKEIMQFQNKLQTLKKNKEKQVFLQKKQQQMREIQERKQRQQRYYEQMMLERERIERELRKKQMEQRQRQLELQEQKRRQQEYLKKINSTAYQKALRQKQQKQAEERRKIDEIKQFLSKRNSYQEKLRSLELQILKKQKPKPVKEKSQTQIRQEQRRLSTKALSAAEIYRMGQEFMEEAHESIDEELIQQSKMFLSALHDGSLRESTRTEYKDYLRQEKVKRERFFQSMGRLQANPEIRELKNLIVKEQNSPQKLLKAKLLTQRLDSKIVVKPKKSSLKLKADSIAAKLKVIQEFT